MMIDRHFDYIYKTVTADSVFKSMRLGELNKHKFRSSLVCVDVTNVAEWINEGHPEKWHTNELFCSLPPWEISWFENKESSKKVLEAMKEFNMLNAFVGILTFRIQAGADENRMYYVVSYVFNEALDSPSYLGRGIFGLDVEGKITFTDFDPSQKTINMYKPEANKALAEAFGTPPEDGPVLVPMEFLFDHAAAMLFAIQFCHCSNVAQHETIPGKKLQGARKKRGKEPLFTFKRLVIQPLRKQTNPSGGSGVEQAKKALHICRGHFSHYGVEWQGKMKGKLFGVHSGSFWIPDHVKGSMDAGIVKKNYDIHAE